MGRQRIVGHQLIGDLPGQCRFNPAAFVDRCQFIAFQFAGVRQFSSLAVQIGATYTGANAILDAANNALTQNGYFIVVDTANAPVGGYTPGTINKDLTIWGSNKGIYPNTGTRVP
jgi:hypothetical protein